MNCKELFIAFRAWCCCGAARAVDRAVCQSKNIPAFVYARRVASNKPSAKHQVAEGRLQNLGAGRLSLGAGSLGSRESRTRARGEP